MPEKTGIVDYVKQREKNYSIKIGDDWYGSYGKCQVSKGDKVKFEYEEEGRWKNIQGSVEKIEEPEQKQNDLFPTAEQIHNEPSKREGLIIRQCCFKGAIDILVKLKTEGIAYTFEGITDAVNQYTNEFEKIILGMYENKTSVGEDE